jgi:hypothetical protein
MTSIAPGARQISLIAAVFVSACVAAAGEAPSPAQTPERAPGAAAVDWTQRPDFAALRSEWAVRDDFLQRCELKRPM